MKQSKRKKITGRNKTNPVDAYLGGQVKHYRRERSMTPTELANEINVTAHQVYQYENGSTRMSNPTIVKIGKALSCHVLDLFGKYASKGDETVKGQQRERIMDVLKYHKKMNNVKAGYCHLIE